MCKLRSFALSLAVGAMVLGSAESVEAVLINQNGTAVFYDTFEAGVVGSGPNPTSPGPGSWAGGGQRMIYDATSGGPGAAEGAQYLRLNRPVGEGMSARTTDWGPIVNGDTFHAEWKMYVSSGARTFAANGGFGNLAIGDVAFWSTAENGDVLYLHSSQGWIDSGIDFQFDAWQTWQQDWVAGSDEMTLTVENASIVLGGLRTDIEANYFGYFSISDGGQYFLDAVPIPEPTAAALISISLCGAFMRPCSRVWQRRS